MFGNSIDPLQPNRRRFIANVASGLLGVNFVTSTFPSAVAGMTPARALAANPRAKRVIYLYMRGAMSQYETIAPKANSDVQGPTKSIDTNVAGVKFAEHMPLLAKHMDKMALIHSLNTETGVHEAAGYTLHTSYRPIASTRHPSLGPWIHRLSGKGNPILPASVAISSGSGYPDSGYLGSQYTPVPIGDARRGLQNIKPPKYLSEEQFNHRMELVDLFDRKFRRGFDNRSVGGYTELYDEAIRLMRSQDLQVFDIKKEPKELRETYGNNPFGQGCLLARRLAQGGVKFIEVGMGGWDFHRQLFRSLPRNAQRLDQGMSALLADLKSLGMLDDTLVVLASEFGRKSMINVNSGRDHQPSAFSCALAGGGIVGGAVHGETDETGRTVEDDPVSVGDLNSTIAYAMGIEHDKEIMSPDDRPFTIGNGGEPVKSLFT